MSFVPAFGNPYPAPGWRAITDFKYVSDLVLLRFSDPKAVKVEREAQYIVAAPYTVSFKLDGIERSLTVPQGLLSDLTSTPAIGRPIVDRVGPHLEAAICHDFLYVAWHDVAGGTATDDNRLFADRLMLAGMKAAGIGLKADLVYRTLRWFGGSAFSKPMPDQRYIDLSQSQFASLGRAGQPARATSTVA